MTDSLYINYVSTCCFLDTIFALPCYQVQEYGSLEGFHAIIYIYVDTEKWEESISTKICNYYQEQNTAQIQNPKTMVFRKPKTPT